MNELKRCDEDFIGVCMVRVLAPRELMIPYLPHKCDGKLMFLLCKKCSLRNNVQRLPCKHNDHERSWIDTYTLIDMQGALQLGYKVVEYIEVWHYSEGGGNMFEEFILNIVRCKIECSGFPHWCTMHELKQQYIDGQGWIQIVACIALGVVKCLSKNFNTGKLLLDLLGEINGHVS